MVKFVMRVSVVLKAHMLLLAFFAVLLCGMPGIAAMHSSDGSALFEDDFGKLSRDNWWITRGSWNDHFGEGKPYDASAARIDHGKLKLLADRTDHVGVMYSRPIAVPKDATIRIARRLFVHAANRKFGGSFDVFGAVAGAPSAVKPEHSNHLFGVTYNNFDYETNLNCFALISGSNIPKGPGKHQGGQAPSISPLWDAWFDEEIIYNSGTGETVYKVNGEERMHVTGVRLEQPCIKLQIHPYGWNTGHYLEMSNLSVSLLSAQTHENNSGKDLQAGTNVKQPQSDNKPGSGISGQPEPKLPPPTSTPAIQEERAAIETLIREAAAAMNEKNVQRVVSFFRASERDQVQKGFSAATEMMPRGAEVLRGAQIDFVSDNVMKVEGITRSAELVALAGGHQVRIKAVKVASTWLLCLNGGR
ncbi:MAG: hypothetical protein HQM09_01005 [Candidatus Riflebacteria bacterium]|nr:hypothetical protein [Candidatus Riflebacteria bacterium]